MTDVSYEAVVHRSHLLGLREQGGGVAAAARAGVRPDGRRSGRCSSRPRTSSRCAAARRWSRLKRFFPGLHPGRDEHVGQRAWHCRQEHPKVTGFVGARRARPTPLTREEVDQICTRSTVAADEAEAEVHVRPRAIQVRINEGPFTSFNGVVDEVNPDRNTLKVMVTIFGRSTPVELDFLQVEKLLDEGGQTVGLWHAWRRRSSDRSSCRSPPARPTPAPPVGTALGPHGVNIMDFCKAFNAKTAAQEGLIIPAVVTVYADRSYSFITQDAARRGAAEAGGPNIAKGLRASRTGRRWPRSPGSRSRRSPASRCRT